MTAYCNRCETHYEDTHDCDLLLEGGLVIAASQIIPREAPFGFIQWKGTDACVDLHCVCGTMGHYDGDQMYSVQCTDCGRKYRVAENVQLVLLETPAMVAANEIYHGDYVPFCEGD